jgi:hypothetical protein
MIERSDYVGNTMSGRKMVGFFGLAVIGTAAAYSAHFVGEQIEYLYDRLSPPAITPKLAPDWPGTAPSLPRLDDLPASNYQNDIRRPKN